MQSGDARREGSEKCTGFLELKSISATFPIWSEVVKFFADRQSQLKVIFAGTWVRFGENDSG